METRYWGQKIRDYIVYETNLVPENVDIQRHQVVLQFKKADLERTNLDTETIARKVQPMIPRKVVVEAV